MIISLLEAGVVIHLGRAHTGQGARLMHVLGLGESFGQLLSNLNAAEQCILECAHLRLAPMESKSP